MANSNSAERERYAQRRACGLCTKCPLPAVTGETLCERCRERKSVNRKRKYRELQAEGLTPYQKWKAQGICVKCGKGVPADGCLECAACRDQAKKWYEYRRRSDLCVNCGEPAAENRVRCSRCLIEENKYYEEAKEAGMCGRCHVRKPESGVICTACLNQIDALREKRVAAGLCQDGCGRPAAPDRFKCEVCLLRYTYRNLNLVARHGGWKGINLPIDDFVQEYFRRLKQCAGLCEWCREPFGSKICADHDHRTGEFRAVLCNACNTLEGYGINRIQTVLRVMKSWQVCTEDLERFKAVDNSDYRTRVWEKAPVSRIVLAQRLTGLNNAAKKSGHAKISLTLDQFAEWYFYHITASKGLCEWCHEPFGKRGPIIDHSHESGIPRGLVCHCCNVVEGFGMSRIEKVLAAMIAWESRNPNSTSPSTSSSASPASNPSSPASPHSP